MENNKSAYGNLMLQPVYCITMRFQKQLQIN